MNKDIYVILVDKNDNQIGIMEKMEAHKKALLHRAISVFIINSKREWLLQQRAFSKYHSNGLWSNTCCSHPLPDESNIDAANRRLMEEMGMKCELEELFQFTYKIKLDNELTEHELDHVFIGITDAIPQINNHEVKEWKYMDFKQLTQDVKVNPQYYSYWFRQIYQTVAQHISNYKK